MEISMSFKDNNSPATLTNRPISSRAPEGKPKKRFSLFKKKDRSSISRDIRTTPVTQDPEKKAKKKKTLKRVFYAILAVLLLGGGFYTYRVFMFTGNIGLKISPSDIFNPIKKDPELKKDSSGKYTNVLLVGIDSRSEKSTLKNTDTIILASYNHETGNTVMFSIPRDFWVEVPDEGWYTKINALYAHGESLKKGDGLPYLAKALKKYTGLEVQYYAMIDLQGFKKVIDTVGGVTVNVENTFTDYCYPLDGTEKSRHFCSSLPGLAQTVTFQSGPQTMNGARALVYARSRHAMGIEGGDFARARRQQRVIDALKSKILSSETLLNPQKLLEIMDALEKNLVISEFTTEDIQAGISLAQKQKEKNSKIYSFVLDYYIGSSKVMMNGAPNAGNASVISTKAGLGNYKDVHAIIKASMEDPQLYKEESVIRVYDTGLGYNKVYAKTAELQQKYPYLNILFMGALFYDKTGNVVYPHKEGLNGRTVDILSEFLKTENKLKPDYITSNLNGEDITILMGKEEVIVQPSNETVQ